MADKKNKKQDNIDQQDDTNHPVKKITNHDIQKALSESSMLKISKDIADSYKPPIVNIIPIDVFQEQIEIPDKISSSMASKVLELSRDNLNDVITKIDRDYSFLYKNLLNLENLKISASAVENLLSSEQEAISKDEFESKAKELKNALDEGQETIRNRAIDSRICPQGLEYLNQNPELYRNFDGESFNTTVVSIDIRSSTQPMLNAKSPKDFVAFIYDLSETLSEFVKQNFGIYDKFTGDGLLCFFPSFYSGESHVYLALKFADKCHQLFNKIYTKHHDKFNAVRSDVGLGIGIDVGDTYITFVNSEPTVIGTSVVYACRLSSAPANVTYINQQVLEVIRDKFQECFELRQDEIEFKGQGKMLVHQCSLIKELDPLPKPDWAVTKVDNIIESEE